MISPPVAATAALGLAALATMMYTTRPDSEAGRRPSTQVPLTSCQLLENLADHQRVEPDVPGIVRAILLADQESMPHSGSFLHPPVVDHLMTSDANQPGSGHH